MQQGFLFHHVSGQPAGVDLEQVVIRLSEPFAPEAFTRAWRQVVARHPVLRTRFRWEDADEPRQEVLAEVEIGLEECDLRAQPEGEREAALEAFVAADRARGFDLREAPLLRLASLRLGEGEWAVLWSFPHAVLDGRSFARVLREVFALYDAARAGSTAELPEPWPYRDYVEWVRGRSRIDSAPFWRERLAGAAVPTPLPGPPGEGSAARGRGDAEARLSRATTGALAALAERHDLSLATLVQSAWAILLARVSGQPDVVFGVTRSGRSRELEAADQRVGLFINTLPVRIGVDGSRALLPWLAELRARERAVRPHEHMPLVEIRRLGEAPAGTPLFESLIVFDRERLDGQVRRGLPGFERRRFELRERTSFPLTLYAYGEPELFLKLAYDRPRFDARSATRTLGHLVTLLEAMASDPERTVGELPMLSEAEQRQILVEWNDTACEYRRDACLHQWIEDQVDRTPDAPAVSCEAETICYRELDERANRLAHRLRELGVGPDVLVGLCAERSIDLVVGVLGIHKAGGAYLPLDPAYPGERIAYMLEDSGASVVVGQAALASQLPVHGAVLVRIDGDPELERMPATRPRVEVRSDQLAYVIYTSGSTGRPKGVMVEHRHVGNFLVGMDARIPHVPRDGAGGSPGTWLALTSLSFDISVLELVWTLARGFHVVVQGDAARDARRGHVPPRAGARSLSFGLFYFAADEGERTGRPDKYELLLEGAKYADAHGYAAVWTPERHFHAFGGLYPNPAVVGAAIAAITEKVQIRAGSVVLPLHHPARVAEEWALVDNLSRGRVGVSMAAGWQPNDFVLRPEGFANARQALFRGVETVRRLWRGEAVSFPGPHGEPVETRTLPRPIQGELPVWITSAGSPETFRQAGRIGAHLLTHLLGQTLEELAERIRAYREAWDEAGHPPGGGIVSLMLHTFVGDDRDAIRETVRRPMMNYLASSLGLIKGFAGAWTAYKKRADGSTDADVDLSALSEAELEDLVAYSFERYFDSSALFGTPEHCLGLVRRLEQIGVDDIACLIDFGVDSETVQAHLPRLTELKDLASAPPASPDAADYRLPAQVARHGVTHLQCTPSMARLLSLDPEARAALKDLEALLIGGEPLPVALANELSSLTSAKLFNLYGPTETTIWSSLDEIEPDAVSVSIGRPIANTRFYVLGPEGNPMPCGAVGELYIGGEGVVRGYRNRPDLTRERFVPDPFGPDPEARLYRTGDLVRWREDGRLDFVGRVDHQVKVRGHRVELGEIEALLELHPAVQEAVVLAREDEEGDQRLVAYLVPRPGAPPASQALREHLREKLPEFMVPAHFVALDAFPQTPNRKVDRRALPDPGELAVGGPLERRRPENAVEERLARIWQDVLRSGPVGRDDNFFDLGGHSLLALKTHRRIVAELEAPDLRITDLFRFPTVRALAAHLTSRAEAPGLMKSRERGDVRRAALARRRIARDRRRRAPGEDGDGG